jgi:uncharacterized membrane protein YjjP (DUF1212 family)
LREVPLPVPVRREFIDTLFDMRLPILGMGIVTAAIAGLVAREWRDPVIAFLALAVALLTVVRLLVL